MNLYDFTRKYKPELQQVIKKQLAERSLEYKDISFYKETLHQIADFSTAGKMLRGLFILLIYSFFKDLDTSTPVFNAASAIELFQSSLLIHDDIIDNDKLRRGKRTIYAQYSDYGKTHSYTNFQEYGKNQGILVGDIASCVAFNLLSNCSDNPAIALSVVQLFAREIHLVNSGQMNDVDMAANSIDPTPEQIIDMYRCKTARYSFSLPFAAGALLGEADHATVKQLVEVGEHIGILFQIHDDWLGLFGSTEETGKPVGSDVREEKKTLYRAIGGSAEKLNTYKTQYEQAARDGIEHLPFTDAQKDMLREIIELVTKRQK